MSNQESNTGLTAAPQIVSEMAKRYKVDDRLFYRTMQKTIIHGSNKRDATLEEMVAFLTVAKQYDLNPWVGEIFAFPKKGGGIQAVVGVDGWCTIINSQPSMDGMEFEDHFSEDGKLESITCRIFRKDRSKPTECTEYMDECFIESKEPWRRWPNRMLRHKALIQTGRYAFGLVGIVDPDEADRMKAAGVIESSATARQETVIDVAPEIEESLEYPEVTTGEESQAQPEVDTSEEHDGDAQENDDEPTEKSDDPDPSLKLYRAMLKSIESADTLPALSELSDQIGQMFASGEVDEDQRLMMTTAVKRRRDQLEN